MPRAAVNGIELYYEVTGQGEPVLLVPGLGLDHTYYRYATPLLARSAKVIAVDLRGTGNSAKPAGRYTTELWADDLAALLDHLGEETTHVVGSSLGGCVALELADRHPDKVRSLVLAASFSEITRAMEINFRMRISIVEQLGMGDVIRDHVSLWTLGHGFLDTPRGEEARKGVLDSLTRNDPALYAEFCRAVLRVGHVDGDDAPGRPVLSERLRGIDVPALVFVGGGDILTVPALSERIAGLLPNARFIVLPDCGHITFIERPEESSRLVTAFLADVDGVVPA